MGPATSRRAAAWGAGLAGIGDGATFCLGTLGMDGQLCAGSTAVRDAWSTTGRAVTAMSVLLAQRTGQGCPPGLCYPA